MHLLVLYQVEDSGGEESWDAMGYSITQRHRNEPPQRYTEYPEIKSPGEKQKSRETQEKEKKITPEHLV